MINGCTFPRLRANYVVTVIGLLEVEGADGRPHVRLNVPPIQVLELGDALVVLGAEERLDALDKKVSDLEMAALQTRSATDLPATEEHTHH